METPVTQTPESITLHLAQPGKRILAYLADAILYFIGVVIINMPVTAISAQNAPSLDLNTLQKLQSGSETDILQTIEKLSSSQVDPMISTITAIIVIIFFLLYYVYVPTQVFKGQTLGKKLFNIKIVRELGQPAEVQDIMKRYFVYFLSALTTLIPFAAIFTVCVKPIVEFVNLILLFSDQRKQTLFDKIAQTVVIEEARP